MVFSVITIVGATGAQGSSVYECVSKRDHLMKNMSEIRLCTRDPNASKAKDLVSKAGQHSNKVKLVKFDLNDKASIKSAFSGTDVVFGVTNPYDPSQQEKEVELGKRMMDMAKECNVKLLVWSGLENCERLTNGKYYVAHFTDKAKIDEYAKCLGLNVINLQPAMYFTNFRYFFPPDKQGNEFKVRMPLHPDTKVAALDIHDYGKVVAKVLENPESYEGKVFPVASENLSVSQYVAKMADHFQVPLSYERCSFEEMPPKLGPLGEELTEMLHYFDEHGYYRPNADLKFAPNLVKMQSFDEWLSGSDWKLQ